LWRGDCRGVSWVDGDMGGLLIGGVLAAAARVEWRRRLRFDHCRWSICETRVVVDWMWRGWRGESVQSYVGISMLVLKSFAPELWPKREKLWRKKKCANSSSLQIIRRSQQSTVFKDMEREQTKQCSKQNIVELDRKRINQQTKNPWKNVKQVVVSPVFW
jgi:hypothetical protein